MFFVYIIFSETNQTKYIGETENLERRIFQHNNNLLGKSTKNKGPWKIIHTEQYKTRTEAMYREAYLKTGVGRDWIKRQFKI